LGRGDLKYVFGPVPSRRLGRSLGVDLVPSKTCTFDCVYCQVGRTTTKTVTRAEFVSVDDVLTELSRALASGPQPDYITLAGSGEPTLFSRLGELIDEIHKLTDVPVDVLTNGSLLFDPQVSDEVSRADLIIPSLDAGDEPTFLGINRPHEAVTFDKLLAGLRQFCRSHGGKVWLEVFLVEGVNDSVDQVSRIASLAKELSPGRVQLNTAVRPCAEAEVCPLSPDRLTELAHLFDPPAEVIADFPREELLAQFKPETEVVVEMLRRRPCTLQDIVLGLNLRASEAAKIIRELIRANRIKSERHQGRLYYLAG